MSPDVVVPLRRPAGDDAWRLPALAHDFLRGLYAHRLLTSEQLHRLYAGGRSARWTLITLARLADKRLVGRVRVAGSRRYAWYLRTDGFVVTEGAGVEVRPYRMTAAQAAGPLQAHTLATNEVGTIFVEAARARGDDCGPADWRNETLLHTGPGARDRTLVADAALDYTVYERGEGVYLPRFIEIDRATTSLRTLVAKIEFYTRVHSYRPAWRHYPRFPGIILVMDGLADTALGRRLAALERDLALSSEMRGCPDLSLSVVTLASLRAHGPFAPIFWRSGMDRAVDVRGR